MLGVRLVDICPFLRRIDISQLGGDLRCRAAYSNVNGAVSTLFHFPSPAHTRARAHTENSMNINSVLTQFIIEMINE